MRLTLPLLLAIGPVPVTPAIAAPLPIQSPDLGPDTTIDAATRSRVIQGVIQRLNPVTGKNREGTGVIPDVPVSADQALRTAHLRALRKILAEEQDQNRRTLLQRAIDEVARRPTSS